MLDVVTCVVQQGTKAFFSEEKKQKTFIPAVAMVLQRARKRVKVFWFFFSKKNRLACFGMSSRRVTQLTSLGQAGLFDVRQERRGLLFKKAAKTFVHATAEVSAARVQGTEIFRRFSNKNRLLRPSPV